MPQAERIGLGGLFIDWAGRCAASDPVHRRLAALERGELNRDRHDSYIKLKKESEHYEMSYLEKRKKDRAFGKFIKTAKKQMKD